MTTPTSPASSSPPGSIPDGSTVAVTGASGFVGKTVIHQLLAKGHTVRALIRDRSKAREAFGSPLPAKLELVSGDVCDARVLDELVRGAAACIHLVGIIREVRGESPSTPQTFQRMHEQATREIVGACERNGVKRYLHMSALNVGPEGRSQYQKTKWAAEQVVRRSSLDWTIFRPALIHGPEGEFVQMMADLASGKTAPYIFIPYFAKSKVDHSVLMGAVDFQPARVQPVAVTDVALAFTRALTTPASIGEVYNLVGSERLDWREICEAFRDELARVGSANKKMPIWYIPGEHAAMMATVASKIGLSGMLPFDAGQALMATEDAIADPSKARLDLGLEPLPFRATLRSYAAKV